MGKKLLKLFTKKVAKNRKGNKLYAEWKGYNNSLKSWIDKKDLLM